MPALWLNKMYVGVNAYCSYNLFSKGQKAKNYEDYYSRKLVVLAESDKRQKLSADEFMDEFKDIDVVVYQRCYSAAALTHMKAMKKLGKKVFVESDDWLFGNITSQRIKKIYGDPKTRLMMETIIMEADGVIVSTEPLGEMYSKYNDNVCVCPNSMDLNLWKWQDIRSEEVKVGFSGSYTHQKDFRDFPISKISKKYPMLFMGLKPTQDIDYLSWVDIGMYPETLSGAFRVGMAPLYRNDFNMAKSPIKWMEYSLAGILTVAENYGPYKIIDDGVDGYLCDGDWVGVIDRAVADSEETERMVCRAQERIKRDYTIDRHINKWVDVFNESVSVKVH